MARYKQLIFAIIIIIFIVILDIVFDKITVKDLDKINSSLSELDKIIFNLASDEVPQNQEQIEEKAENIVKKWEEIHKVLACYIEHDEIEKVADKLKLIEKQVKIQQFGDAGQAITEAEFLLEHLKEKQKVTLENIF
jgi:uncharacterized protein YaaN involved in tellurite resistance